MKAHSITLIVLAVFAYLPFSVQAAESYSESYPLLQVLESQEVSQGEVQLRANVIYPNGCFQPESSVSSTDNEQNKIYLSHEVEVVRIPCTQALVENYPEFDFPKPENGLYQLIDIVSHRFLGTLEVSDEGVRFTPPEQTEE
ncbi:MAG: hypothetical protein KDD22_05170 [Bdellovibrionales bacterium]|nr:hypothetical protein [Bdellovibrionales bacterium]